MNDRFHILIHLARRYERSKAGRTNEGRLSLYFDYEEFLAEAGCATGVQRIVAEKDLDHAERTGVLQRIGHPKDPQLYRQLRFRPEAEAELYALLGQASPRTRREGLAKIFIEAAATDIPDRWRSKWLAWCERMAHASNSGGSIAPLSREDVEETSELLALLPKLLTWKGESLIRFTSCVLCGDSKRLGELSGKLGRLLCDLSEGEISSLEELQVLETPRTVLLHGPVRFCLEGQWVDLGIFSSPVRLSVVDISRAEHLVTGASHCLTVENETTFHELAKLHSRVLLICTSFPGSATRALLQRLPDTIEYWHFGDTDAAGFEILRDLRVRTGRPFKSLHMQFRSDSASPPLTLAERGALQRLADNPLMLDERDTLRAILAAGLKGHFEQESLGRPTTPWPFYR